jgi:3-hydroxymyristoyl/3-hydroxydecanoyl-(acyl carrier protein) dehydratase
MSEHFPGDPVVPAYLQLLHVREMACTFLNARPESMRVKSVKFLAPLKPESSVDVWLERRSGGGVTFKLLRDGQIISQGEISVG